MPFSVSCPCGKTLRVPDEFAGRRVKCPACGRGVAAPGEVVLVEVEPRKAVRPAPRRPVSDEDDGRRDERRRPRQRAAGVPVWPFVLCGALLVIAGGGVALIFALGGKGTSPGDSTPGGSTPFTPLPGVDPQAADRKQSQENLRQLAIAFNTCAEQRQGQLPSASNQLHMGMGNGRWSWRVAMLPYLGKEEEAIFRQLKFNEPWDGPHNSKVLAKMPKVFQMPGKPENNMTYYQVFVGPKALFGENLGPRFPASFNTKGTTRVILVAESATPVFWAEPKDIRWDGPGSKSVTMQTLGGHFGDDVHVVTGDAMVRTLSRSRFSDADLEWAIDPFNLQPPPPSWTEK